MEVFSLEDDDCNELFITQESKDYSQNEEVKMESGYESFLGLDPFDFQSPCKSVICNKSTYAPHCSDLSDEKCDGKLVMDSKSGR